MTAGLYQYRLILCACLFTLPLNSFADDCTTRLRKILLSKAKAEHIYLYDSQTGENLGLFKLEDVRRVRQIFSEIINYGLIERGYRGHLITFYGGNMVEVFAYIARKYTHAPKSAPMADFLMGNPPKPVTVFEENYYGAIVNSLSGEGIIGTDRQLHPVAVAVVKASYVEDESIGMHSFIDPEVALGLVETRKHKGTD